MNHSLTERELARPKKEILKEISETELDIQGYQNKVAEGFRAATLLEQGKERLSRLKFMLELAVNRDSVKASQE